MATPTPEPSRLAWLFRREQRTTLHPLSGAAMLTLDWLLFGSEVLTGFLLEPLLMPLGALLGFATTVGVERFYARRGWGRSLLAAMFGAAVVGVPWPISGTLIGVLVLALSGLRGTGIPTQRR